MNTSNTVPYQAARTVFEVTIAAPVERVWAALVHEIDAWWSTDFYYRPYAQRFVLEPRIGGSVYEEWGDGEGFVWYTVTAIRKGELLRLSGELDLQYGPGHVVEQFELRAEGDGTVVTFTNQMFGGVAEKHRRAMDEGWHFLIEKCLQPYVEGSGGAPE